jgi:hypothetical protein
VNQNLGASLGKCQSASAANAAGSSSNESGFAREIYHDGVRPFLLPVYARRVGVYPTRMDLGWRPLEESLYIANLRSDCPNPQILCMLVSIPDRYGPSKWNYGIFAISLRLRRQEA